MSDKKKLIVKLDLSDWDLAGWPGEIYNAISIEKNRYQIDISIEPSLFDAVVRKIITEAFETYFAEANWELGKDGLRVLDINYEREFTVPMHDLIFDDLAAIEAMEAYIAKTRKECEASDD